MEEQLAFRFGGRYKPGPVIGFNSAAFREPPKMRDDSLRTIYLNNLTTALYKFYGGDVGQIAALETPEDSYTDRYGNSVRRIEHYADKPVVSIETCRTLAEMILEENQYSEALDILRHHDKERVQKYAMKFLAPYVSEMDNLELTRVHTMYDLERLVA